MKEFLLIINLIFFITISQSQNTTQFKESQYLKLDSSKFYVTVIGDTIIRLKIKKKNGFTLKTTGISINKKDTIFHKIRSEENKYIDFISTDFNLSKTKRLYGDFVQDKNIIKFYPWKFTENDTIEKKLNKNKYYVIEIPERTVVKTKYSAWHYGALTLPAKFYTKSVDSISSSQFDANLNLMIGRKWGNKKYSFLGEEATTPFTIAKSINLIAGINKLTLNPSNTNKKLTKEITVASLSYGLAFGLQYKKIGLFIASGFDTPLSDYGNDWVFKNNLWFGFGLGLGL